MSQMTGIDIYITRLIVNHLSSRVDIENMKMASTKLGKDGELFQKVCDEKLKALQKWEENIMMMMI